MFDLVAEVERYLEFMPWVHFSAAGVLDRPHRIDISSRDAMFDRFIQRWIFESVAAGGTNVEYHVDFKFRSRVLQLVIEAAFADRAVATMAACKGRAHRLCGGHA